MDVSLSDLSTYGRVVDYLKRPPIQMHFFRTLIEAEIQVMYAIGIFHLRGE